MIRLGIDLVDDLQAVLIVPLLTDLGESVLRCQLVRGHIVGLMVTRTVRTRGSRAARWSRASSAARA